MEKDKWKLIEELFNQALDLPQDQRSVFLEKECPDKNIREEVEQLLDNDQKATGFIESTALEVEAQKIASENWKQSPPQRVGKYEILELLGSGGMGSVHKARHIETGQIVALKQLLPHFVSNPNNVRRFYREAKAIKALKHPNIASLVEVSSDELVHFIAMEHVEGRTLAHIISSEGPLELKRTLQFAKQTGLALRVAHARGIIHRDIKPSNLLVQKDGTVKVLDFGLAKALNNREHGSLVFSTDSITKTGVLVGTVNYMSPEQLMGKPLDQRSDIFSLGIVIYEMATGKLPFPGDSLAAKITAVLDSPPVPLRQFFSDWPAEFEKIAYNCLEKDPDRRYQSANELIRDVSVILGEPWTESDLPGLFGRIKSWFKS
jgi:serine/threonine-protein kinase